MGNEQNQVTWDLLVLGEVMLRFDPGDTRIRCADTFTVWEGGGEYNVARGLSTCFGKKTAVVTSLVRNEIGKLLQRKIMDGGVDTSLILWMDDDGIGETARNGIYFLEKGFGIRPPLGTSDRGHTAVSQLKPGQINWEEIFSNHAVKWFHTGGIFAGLSSTTPLVILEAVKAARKLGVLVSYDLNYRPSLWNRLGGKKAANKVNHQILEHVDFLIGIDALDEPIETLSAAPFEKAITTMIKQFPNLKAVASTMRLVHSANCHDWSGLLWCADSFYQGVFLPNLDIYDRVGGGDAFASGLIYGFMEQLPLSDIINYAVVHGALTMSTPGDNSMVTKDEIENFLRNNRPDVKR